jgi:hypothetical protein
MKLSFEDEESLKEAVGSLRFDNPPSDPNTRQLGVESSSSMPLQDQDQDSERNEDIYFNNPPGDPNTLPSQRMGSSSSMQPQERSEDIEMVQPSHSTTNSMIVVQVRTSTYTYTPDR